MRVLFTFAGGAGHAEPLVPIARAARAAGHDVAFAGRPWVVARLVARGFAGFPDTGDPVEEPTAITPLVEFDATREDRLLRRGRAAAERIRSETLALPDAAHAVGLLERLVSAGSAAGA